MHRRRDDDDQVSVERSAFTAMDELQRPLADAVELVADDPRPGEPLTAHELVILSPCAREGADDSQVPDARLTSCLGTHISDSTRIRWGTIHG